MKRKLLSLLVLLITAATGAWAQEVTITSEDITQWLTDGEGGTSFTKDIVTITCDDENIYPNKIIGPGTFSTLRGHFTKIVVTAFDIYDLGTGWSGNQWTGNASSVPFDGSIEDGSMRIEFYIAPTYNLTANEGATGEYWATFYSNASNYQASSGTQVFKVNLSGDAITMTEITDGIVKSGQGVVLKNTTGSSITMTPTASESSDNYSGNSLTGTMTEINTTGTNNYYVLNYKAATGAGFYKLSNTSGTIGANKAYLIHPAAAREFFLFDEATGISATLNDNVEMTNDNVYDLQGRRVSEFGIRNSELKRGLYIVNGKKVIK